MSRILSRLGNHVRFSIVLMRDMFTLIEQQKVACHSLITGLQATFRRLNEEHR